MVYNLHLMRTRLLEYHQPLSLGYLLQHINQRYLLVQLSIMKSLMTEWLEQASQ